MTTTPESCAACYSPEGTPHASWCASSTSARLDDPTTRSAPAQGDLMSPPFGDGSKAKPLSAAERGFLDSAQQLVEVTRPAALAKSVTSARHSIDTAIAITRAVARGSDLRNLADAEAMLSAALRHLGQAEIQIEQVRSRIGFGAL